ncbi:hypothetical protein ACA910_005882 [Epithemia clementina (nom. ined.)]
MVRLNVFFLIHGEEEEGFKSNRLDLPHMCSLKSPSLDVLDDLTRKIDPALTEDGFQQAENSFRAMATAFRKSGEKRRIALISEPFRRCTASALMVSTAGFEPQEWSEWGLTSPSTASAPSAIPIVVMNGLIDANPGVRQMGGQKVVIDGGLVHCAAEFWNKAYKKDPIMGVVQQMKDVVQQRIKEWLNTAVATKDMGDYRMAADVQYLRFEKKGDPYSLIPLSLKFSIEKDLQKPSKILDPHRSGMYRSKVPPLPESVSQSTLDRAIETARKCGCDTIIMVVTPELVREIFDERMDHEVEIDLPPGAVVSMVAKTKKEGMSWKLHALSFSGQFTTDALPPYNGPIEPTKEAPEEFKKAMEKAGEEKWGAFPPPLPEIIPPAYPEIPPFSRCLENPEPTAKWAWVNMPK